jgi:hypothetical protein
MRSYPEGNRNAIELRCCIAALIGCYQRYSYWGLPKDWQIMINNSTIGAMDGRRTPVAAWNPLGRTFEAFSSSNRRNHPRCCSCYVPKPSVRAPPEDIRHRASSPLLTLPAPSLNLSLRRGPRERDRSALLLPSRRTRQHS